MEVILRQLRVLVFLMKDAFKEFKKNDPLRFGSSTAFFTTFALVPILVILTNIMGMLYQADYISQQLIYKLQDMLGARGARQLFTVLENIRHIPTHWSIALIGTIFLLFVSTTLFIVVQKALNELWNIQPKKKSRKLKKLVKNRGKSLAIILGTGFLFLVLLLAESLLAFLGNGLDNYLPHTTVYLIRAGNFLLYFSSVTVWFAITFRYLPDARIHWRPAWVGAGVTAILFTIGKFLLNQMLVSSNLGPIYGPSASVLMIMLFVFYSAMILFYGASFTHTYANYAAFSIKPKSYARHRLGNEKEKKKGNKHRPEETGHLPLPG